MFLEKCFQNYNRCLLWFGNEGSIYMIDILKYLAFMPLKKGERKYGEF